MSENNLKARIQEDMKAAMRAKEQLRLGTIRMLMAAIKQREIDDRTTLNDAQILSVINKMIKQRHDAADQFQAASRQELADKENMEIAVLETYLPAQLSESEIQQAIRAAIASTNATSMKDMGKVMSLLKTKLEGQVDMAVVSAKVKQDLS